MSEKINKENLEKDNKTDPQQPIEENLEGVKKSNFTPHNIYIVGGNKGGTGKSFFTRIMLEYFMRKKWQDNFILIDADPMIHDVSDVFKDKCKKIHFSDNKFSQSEPLEIFKSVQKQTVVVNLPSNISDRFDSWLLLNGALEDKVREMYKNIYYFFVSDGCYRSIDSFIKQVDFYQKKQMPHILVLNPGRLTCSGTFHYLEEDRSLIDTLKKHQIPVLLCPELATDLQFFCDREKVTYHEAVEKADLTINQQRIVSFLRQVDIFFDKLFVGDSSSIDNISDNCAKICKEQKKKLNVNELPIPSREELLKELMVS
jgi:hypothetical protein